MLAIILQHKSENSEVVGQGRENNTGKLTSKKKIISVGSFVTFKLMHP